MSARNVYVISTPLHAVNDQNNGGLEKIQIRLRDRLNGRSMPVKSEMERSTACSVCLRSEDLSKMLLGR